MNDETHFYAIAGRASVIIGMQKAIDILQAALNQMRAEMRAEMAAIREAPLPTVRLALDASVEAPKRGRPPKSAPRDGPGRYWDSLTPEERSAEMLHRRAVRAGLAESRKAKPKGPRKSHPRYADHPGHAAWLAKMRKASKARWANYRAARVNGGVVA